MKIKPVVPARPVAEEPREYNFPEFSRHQLSNGMGVVVAPVHKLPIVTIQVVQQAGATCDTTGKEGLALLVAQLLSEGTVSLGAEELTSRMEMMGSAVSSSADWDHASVSTTVERRFFEDALEVVADVVVRPALPERELNRLKQERLAELLQTKAEPRSLADEKFASVIFDATSRFAAPSGGGESSVSGISASDVRNFHATYYRPSLATVIVSGDMAVGEALAAVERAFGGWSGAGPEPAAVRASVAAATGPVHLVGKRGAPQSELRIGHVGIPRSHPDYFDVVVMNAILGGLFSSRINLNLREKHGYTYGASSYFDWRRSAGPFAVATAVQSDVTAAAIREVFGEIDRIRSEPVAESELSLAVSYITGVFPIRFETTAAISNALATMVIFGLPSDFYDSYRDRMNGVNAEGVLAAARAHIRPEELKVLVVGDSEVVASQLAELQLGGITRHDAS